ncbi:hypothetical protein B0J18DRAFT_180799 [Chaetomium sp. MPI-SDFR-AT-0129]|nr:hypothetical protein B0J18DRAFT_180799 [Chaetomium sp. MPI-SDFR-AT-0129]
MCPCWHSLSRFDMFLVLTLRPLCRPAAIAGLLRWSWIGVGWIPKLGNSGGAVSSLAVPPTSLDETNNANEIAGQSETHRMAEAGSKGFLILLSVFRSLFFRFIDWSQTPFCVCPVNVAFGRSDVMESGGLRVMEGRGSLPGTGSREAISMNTPAWAADGPPCPCSPPRSPAAY